MNRHFDGCRLERGPPSLPPRHSGGLHLPGDPARGQARQVAHLPRGCWSTRRERRKRRRKKKRFLFIFHFRFFIRRQFSHAVIFPVTTDHKAARNTPQMCTPGWDSPDHSWLSFSNVGQNPCHACFSPLTVNTVQGAGSGGEVSIAAV